MTTMTVNTLTGAPGAARTVATVSRVRPAADRLHVDLSVQGGLPTAHLIGELDADSAGILERLIDDLAAQGEPRVVLDLRQLFSVDLAGVAALRDAAALLRECDGWLSLAALRPRVRYFLARAGIAEHFATYRSVDDAVRAAAGQSGGAAAIPGGTADDLRQPVDGSTSRPLVPSLVSTLTRR